MKRIITLLVLLTTSLFYAQTTGITYQAVIYNPTGEILPGNNNQNAVLANKDICLRFSIKDATTNLEYQETQKVKTDEFGMVNVVIGQGGQIGGYASNFDAILWNSTTKKLQVEMDTTGNCSVFIEVSDQDFSAVPFAYASKTAENVSGIVAIANGGTGASTVVGAKTNLGLNNVDNTSDANKPISTATQTALDTKAPLASPALTGTPTVPTATIGTNTTQIANTAFVTSAIAAAATPDATATVKGKIKLTGDLGGTADAPTVPGLANKENTIAAGTTAQYYRGDKSWQTLDKTAVGLSNVNNTTDADKPVSTATQTALDAKEAAANKSTNPALGTSDDLFPTQKAVKTYVDNQISAGVVDATATVKGKIQLTGDLGGTADAPLVPGLAFKAPLNSPQFTGTPSLPTGTVAVTQAANDNSTAVATTAYVTNALSTANSNARSNDLDMAGNSISNALAIRAGNFQMVDEVLHPFFGGNDDNSVTILNRNNNVTQFVDGRTGSPILAITNSVNEEDEFGTPTPEEGKIGIGTTTPSEKLQVIGNIKSQSFIKDNGTAGQFLKADGSVDANTYLTTTSATGTYEPIITAGTTAQYLRGDKTFQTLDKAAVGLGNVSNTADADKPVSNDTQAALNLKANLASPTFTGDPKAVTATTGDNDTSVATTAFVSTAITNAATPVATTTSLGKIQLGGDLAGTGTTAAAPVISDNAVTTTKIADNAVTNAKLGEIVSVNKGGTGSNLTTTAGYVKQATAGANLSTVSSIPVADVAGAVSSVNGVTPVDGNVSVLLGRVFQGVQVDPTQANSIINVNSDTNLLNNTKESDIYIVVGNSDSANNGRTFIFNGTTWLEVAINLVSTDPRYVNTTGDTMEGDLTVPTGKKITLTDAPANATDAANKNYVDSLVAGKQNTITLTTTGSGAASLVGATLNIPTPNNGTVTEVSALTIGTSGTDITSTVATATTTPVITLNVPTASATNRGALSAADWTTFNDKVGGSGTENFVPKFSGTSPSKTLVNSSIFDDGTKVGIGTASPTTLLSVQGSANVDNANANTGTIANSLLFGNGTGEGIGSTRSGTTNIHGLNFFTSSDIRMAITNSGFIGLGTTSPFSPLSNTSSNIFGSDGQGVNGFSWSRGASGYAAAIYNSGNTASYNGLAVKVANNAATTYALDVSRGTAQATAGTSLFNVLGNGNVGIGTASPISLFSNAPSGTNFVGSANATQSSNGISWLTNSTGYNTSLYNAGTAAGSNGLQVKVANTSPQTIAFEVGQNATLNGTSTPLFNVLGNGSVGVGTNAPSGTFEVATSAGLSSVIRRFGNTNLSAANLVLQKTYGTTATSHGAGIVNGDFVGRILFSASNGTDYGIYNGTDIVGYAAGTQSATNFGGGIFFRTVPQNTGSGALAQAVERMRIADNGNIGIGTSSPTAQLHTTGTVLLAGAGTPAAGKVLTSDASGNATWQPVNYSTLISTKVSSFNLAASDAGNVIVVDSPVTVTVTVPPSTLSTGFYCQIIQQGAGQVKVVGGTGVTVTSALGNYSRTSGSSIGIMLTNSTTAFLSGDTSLN